MKLAFSLLLTFSFLSSAVTITSNFDRGSLDTLIETSPDYFEGKTMHWQKADGIGSQRYWFYFRMDGVAGKKITVKFNDIVGVYRGSTHDVYTDYTRPVFSYDNENWGRVDYAEEVDADSSFFFTHECASDPVWFAYAHPYPLGFKDRLVASLDGNQYVTVDSIGASPQNRPIHMLTITDAGMPDSVKKTAVVTSLQHPGEDAAGYFMEGMVNFLVSDVPDAVTARRNFVYIVFPAMNPDGLYMGTSRYNANMEDLNTEWDDGLTDTVNTVMEPEVQAVMDWAAAWKAAGKSVDVMFDLHNHTQFFRENRWLCVPDEVENLHAVMDVYWPITYIRTGGDGRPRTHFNNEFGSLGITVELTQGFVYPGRYLEPDDYRQWGAYTVQGTYDYYFPDASPPQAADPVISPDGGSYSEPQEVTLTCATEDARLHYTLDGTEPTMASARYFSPVTVPVSCTLNVKAFRGGYTASNTVSAVFDIDGGLVAYWDFKEPEGTYTTDVQGGIRADIVGAARVEGKFGPGMLFQGDDYLLIPPDDRLNFGAGDFTYACWFKTAGKTMDLWDGGVGGPDFAYFWVRIEDSTTTHRNLCRIDDGSASVQLAPDGPSLMDTAWHHLAFTRKSGLLSLYIDGQHDTSMIFTGVGSIDNIRWKHIGRSVYADVPDSYSEGVIDEVRLYSKALDGSAVSGLYRMVINELPVLVREPGRYVHVQWDEFYSDTIMAVDPDYDSLSYVLFQGPDNFWVTPTGWLTYMPEGSERETVIVEISDKNNGKIIYDMVIRVNFDPDAEGIPDTVISLGEMLEYPVSATDKNDDDSLVFIKTAGPAALTVNDTGLITWTPDSSETVSVAIRVEDMYGGADSVQFNIAVLDTPKTGMGEVPGHEDQDPVIGLDGFISVTIEKTGTLTLYGPQGEMVRKFRLEKGMNRLDAGGSESAGIRYYRLDIPGDRRSGRLLYIR